MSKEFKIPQYTPLQINSNIAYGLTKEDNISRDELDSIQWLCEAYEHQNKQISDLEAKLTEKEKEITERMMAFEKRCQEYYKSKEFTIEQLEKVKEKAIKPKDYGWCDKYKDCWDIVMDIDNQIKQLKENKQWIFFGLKCLLMNIH